jgi:hypothetical protein
MQSGRDNLLDETVDHLYRTDVIQQKASGSIQYLECTVTVCAFLYKHVGKLDSQKSLTCIACVSSSEYEGGARRCYQHQPDA